MSPSEIAEMVNRSVDSVNQALRKLKNSSVLYQPGYGLYDLAERAGTPVREDRKAPPSDGPGEGLSTPATAHSPYLRVPEVVVRRAGSTGEVTLTEAGTKLLLRPEDVRREYGVEPERLCCLRVVGDTMEPTLRAGQRVLAARWDADEPLRDGVIYALSGPLGFMLKRLRFRHAHDPQGTPQDVICVVSDSDERDGLMLSPASFEAEYRVLARVLEVSHKL
jgi:hypothetical protein